MRLALETLAASLGSSLGNIARVEGKKLIQSHGLYYRHLANNVAVAGTLNPTVQRAPTSQ